MAHGPLVCCYLRERITLLPHVQDVYFVRRYLFKTRPRQQSDTKEVVAMSPSLNEKATGLLDAA